ncbi:MAG: hypothetical protein ACYTEQ_09460 [Planctomycetota bacterium]|jgi:hypothetical protein
MTTPPDSARARLAITAQSCELTADQVAALRAEYERIMEEYDLLPMELSWLLGGIAAVIFTERRAQRGERKD